MKESLRVGVVGCGRVAQTRHIPGFLYAPGCEITALYNRTRSRAKGLLSQCPNAELFDDYEALLRDGNIDAVTICTPNFQHATMTLAALRAGKHVLVEKPMAMTLRQADDMIAAAERAGKILMVHQNVRDHPAHIAARELIQSGEVGRVFLLNAMFAHAGAVYPEAPSSDWFLDDELAGMGCMGDIGIHKADIIRYITGSEVTAVSAFTLSANSEATVEDNAAAALSLDNGAVATIATSWNALERVKRLTIVAEKATLLIDLYVEPCLKVRRTGEEEPSTIDLPAYVGNPEYFSKSIVEFVRAARGEIDCPIDGYDGRKSLEVVLAAVTSANEKRRVELPMT